MSSQNAHGAGHRKAAFSTLGGQSIKLESVRVWLPYRGLSCEETLKRWQIKPQLIREIAGGQELELLNYDKFRLTRIEVDSRFDCLPEATFSSMVVLSGNGAIREQNRWTPIRPAGLKGFTLEAGDRPLVIVRCFPPA